MGRSYRARERDHRADGVQERAPDAPFRRVVARRRCSASATLFVLAARAAGILGLKADCAPAHRAPFRAARSSCRPGRKAMSPC
jgi:hypothetical protein